MIEVFALDETGIEAGASYFAGTNRTTRGIFVVHPMRKSASRFLIQSAPNF